MRTLFALLAVVFLAACACAEPRAVAYEGALAAPLAAPACAPCAAAAPVLQAPLMAGQYATVYGAPGASEHARAGLAIPPAVAACLVTGASKMLLDGVEAIRCALDNLVPRPQPSQQLVRLVPASSLRAAPACAPAPLQAPCAPPPMAPAPKSGCNEPPVSLAPACPAGVCTGQECAAR